MGKKVFNISRIVIKVFAIILVVLFAGFVLIQRFSNSSFSFFGYRMFAVVTGSMEPVYGVGDVLLCKDVDTDSLKVGDDISYLGKVGSFKDKIITHRLKRIGNKDGQKVFHTQGVASNTEDPAVYADQIYGKVTRRLILLSIFHRIASSSAGFFICIVIPIMLLVGTEIIQTMLEHYDKTKKAMETANNQQNTISDLEKELKEKEQLLQQQQLQQEVIKLQQQVAAQTQNNEQNNQNNE